MVYSRLVSDNVNRLCTSDSAAFHIIQMGIPMVRLSYCLSVKLGPLKCLLPHFGKYLRINE